MRFHEKSELLIQGVINTAYISYSFLQNSSLKFPVEMNTSETLTNCSPVHKTYDTGLRFLSKYYALTSKHY